AGRSAPGLSFQHQQRIPCHSLESRLGRILPMRDRWEEVMFLPQETITRSLDVIYNIQIVKYSDSIDHLVTRLVRRQEIIIISWVNAHTLTVALKDSNLAASLLK